MAYPDYKEIKYPKPGYPNPVVDVYIHPLGGQPWKVPSPVGKRDIDDLFDFVGRAEGDETDGWGDKKLITNVAWMGEKMVMISETNRVSDHFRGILVDIEKQSGQVVRDEKIEDGWFEIVLPHLPC
jgi:dipeptidyl aminopeptidase B